MIKWFKRLLFDSTPAEFISDFSIDESVQRLSKDVCRLDILTLFGKSLVGFVSPTDVQLTRAAIIRGKSYGTYYRMSFCGKFQEQDGRVILTGQFQLTKNQRVSLILSLCFLPLFTFMLILQLFGDTPEIGFISLFPIGMLVVLFAVTAHDKSHCLPHDIAWLSKTIKQALSNPSEVQTNND